MDQVIQYYIHVNYKRRRCHLQPTCPSGTQFCWDVHDGEVVPASAPSQFPFLVWLVRLPYLRSLALLVRAPSPQNPSHNVSGNAVFPIRPFSEDDLAYLSPSYWSQLINSGSLPQHVCAPLSEIFLQLGNSAPHRNSDPRRNSVPRRNSAPRHNLGQAKNQPRKKE